MAVWFAHGEAGARPVYQKIVSAWDRAAAKELETLFEAIIEDGQYTDSNAADLAMGYSALIMTCTSLLVTPRELTKKQAKSIAKDFLQRVSTFVIPPISNSVKPLTQRTDRPY